MKKFFALALFVLIPFALNGTQRGYRTTDEYLGVKVNAVEPLPNELVEVDPDKSGEEMLVSSAAEEVSEKGNVAEETSDLLSREVSYITMLNREPVRTAEGFTIVEDVYRKAYVGQDKVTIGKVKKFIQDLTSGEDENVGEILEEVSDEKEKEFVQAAAVGDEDGIEVMTEVDGFVPSEDLLRMTLYVATVKGRDGVVGYLVTRGFAGFLKKWEKILYEGCARMNDVRLASFVFSKDLKMYWRYDSDWKLFLYMDLRGEVPLEVPVHEDELKFYFRLYPKPAPIE